MDSIEHPEVRAAFAEWKDEFEGLVQNRLLTESDFLRFAKGRGVEVFGVITGDPALFYERGWLRSDGEAYDGSPVFHPFRIYPLHWILESCGLHIAASASIHRERFPRLVQQVVENHLPPLERIGETASNANTIVDLPILLEPVYWPKISGKRVFRGVIDEEEHRAQAEKYRTKALELVARLDEAEWQNLHERLRHHAAMLDENHDLYLLLRVAPWSRREQAKGRISGALWIRHMAEVLRLAFEEVHGVTWEEEDKGFGQWMKGARIRKYGSERPLDKPTRAKPYLAFEFGLHTGSLVRWYVEGETELGAVREALPGAANGGIELVNLKGSLETRPGVAMKLSDSLEQDRAVRRFSVISFDLDERNTVRTIRQQIRRGKVIGFVSGHDPDFEFANFNVPELIEVAALLDEEMGLSPDPIRKADWSGIFSGSEFEARYRSLSSSGLHLKGERWGAALARYALENPQKLGSLRPFLTEVDMVLRSLIVHYDFYKERYRIDPDTFELFKVDAPDSPWTQ